MFPNLGMVFYILQNKKYLLITFDIRMLALR